MAPPMLSAPPRIAPFRALRYSKTSDLARLVAPPYDVISPELQASLYERHPQNIVRLILGRESAADTPDDNRYTRAARDLETWVREKILIRDERPAIYLYEEEFERAGCGHLRRCRRRGFLALQRLEGLGEGVRPHEKTIGRAKEDRLRLIQNCHANLSPVFALYADPRGEVNSLLAPWFEGEPKVDLLDDESVRHRLWRVEEAGVIGALTRLFSSRTLYLADGHHRYETALAYREWMKKRCPEAGPEAPFHYLLMYYNALEDPGLVILPTHRVLLDVKPKFLLERLGRELEIRQIGDRGLLLKELWERGRERHCFGIAFPESQCLALGWDQEAIDVLLVHEILIRKILGFTDEDERDAAKILYVRDEAEVFRFLEEGRNRIGIFLNPPRPEDFRRVVEQGIILPPKSTYFYPKLLSGLLIQPIDPREEVT